MASQNLINIGSNNGVLPDGTKPLPQPLLITLVLHRITINLGPIYELNKNLDFLDSWAVVKILLSDRKLVFASMWGSDWHTSKQKCL